VAASLLQAAGEGAAANVRINLGAWSEESFRTAASAETDLLIARGSHALARVRAALAG
jgi:formiminotetrahydrofolate cyclodeaminase